MAGQIVHHTLEKVARVSKEQEQKLCAKLKLS